MKRIICLSLGLGLGQAALAESPQSLLKQYTTEAIAAQAGFAPSAARGGRFYSQRFSVADRLPACSTCHTDHPSTPGQHAITGKTIRPLSPLANPERFSDSGKVEKWFGRNCKEVVGRPCTPGEKADFIQFLLEAKS